MANKYLLIQWKNINDKVLNDTTKFIIVDENVTTPSLIGLQPDLEYFAERVPYAMPIYDYRLAVLYESKNMTEDIEPSTNCRYYDLLYVVSGRTLEEKYQSIDDIKNNANFSVFPMSKQLEYLAMYAAIIRRELNNQTITPQMVALRNKVEAKVTKIWQNHITAINKKANAALNEPIDIDDDWEDIDPENE